MSHVTPFGFFLLFFFWFVVGLAVIETSFCFHIRTHQTKEKSNHEKQTNGVTAPNRPGIKREHTARITLHQNTIWQKQIAFKCVPVTRFLPQFEYVIGPPFTVFDIERHPNANAYDCRRIWFHSVWCAITISYIQSDGIWLECRHHRRCVCGFLSLNCLDRSFRFFIYIFFFRVRSISTQTRTIALKLLCIWFISNNLNLHRPAVVDVSCGFTWIRNRSKDLSIVYSLWTFSSLFFFFFFWLTLLDVTSTNYKNHAPVNVIYLIHHDYGLIASKRDDNSSRCDCFIYTMENRFAKIFI